jgi:major membrane immunogen (membrane-anchored lipoprotein)
MAGKGWMAGEGWMAGMRRPGVRGALLTAVVGASLLSGCGGSETARDLPDGSYSGRSEVQSDGSYGVVKFTVKSNTVTAASFVIYDKDGTPHDKNYGSNSSDKSFYQRAQNAVAAEQKYVAQFKETGSQGQVEKIAGASLSYKLFNEAVDAAISEAGK